MIRKISKQEPRVETGIVQFGDDWPGIFIRGDRAFFYSINLQSLAKLLSKCNQEEKDMGQPGTDLKEYVQDVAEAGETPQTDATPTEEEAIKTTVKASEMISEEASITEATKEAAA
jgi:hypothetical protein